MRKRRLRRLRISAELLVDALGLPKGTEIEGSSYSLLNGEVTLRIRHSSFRAIQQGEEIPYVGCVVTELPHVHSEYQE